MYYFYACGRANPDNANDESRLTAGNEEDGSDQGLWSRSTRCPTRAANRRLLIWGASVDQDPARAQNTTTRVYFAWAAVEGASYEVQFAQLDSGADDRLAGCPDQVREHDGSLYRDRTGQAHSLRVRYTLRVGGRTLRSDWSTAGFLSSVAN